MRTSRWYLLGAALGVVILLGWWMSSPSPTTVLDLVAHLPNAKQQRPSPDAFQVLDVTLAGETKRSIYVAQPSRLIWEEVVPERGWLQVSLGVREEAWPREGNGVLFMVGVSHEGKYEELVSVVVNPFANDADRRWLSVLLDLAPWAGQRIEIVLNTRLAHADASPANHLAVWGAPALVTR